MKNIDDMISNLQSKMQEKEEEFDNIRSKMRDIIQQSEKLQKDYDELSTRSEQIRGEYTGYYQILQELQPSVENANEIACDSCNEDCDENTNKASAEDEVKIAQPDNNEIKEKSDINEVKENNDINESDKLNNNEVDIIKQQFNQINDQDIPEYLKPEFKNLK